MAVEKCTECAKITLASKCRKTLVLVTLSLLCSHVPCSAVLYLIMFHAYDFFSRGVDSRLHTCGVGHWFVTAIRSVVPIRVYNDYRKLKTCMIESDPFLRCSLRQACSDAERILSLYLMS